MNHFKGKQFQQDVIIVAVGYYLRYNLSYREVQEILYDRGINVSHTTIYRWVQEYGKLLYQIWKKKNRQSFYSWKMDETYIKIKGRWHYLYRAIDADGLTLDIWLRKKRDTQAAYAFLKRYRAIDADGLTLDIWLRKKRDTQAAYAFLKRFCCKVSPQIHYRVN
ncbi:IS6 family transposase [Listeria monocytogenes]|nr:IS6 family transposase [Listeria monocytogenes]